MDSLYCINRLLMFLSMILYVPFTLVVVAGLCTAAVLLTVGAMACLPIVVIVDVALVGISVLLVAGLFKLFARLRSGPAPGVLLSRETQKHFFDLLDKVCRKLDVLPPEECYLSPFSDTHISDRILTKENGRGRRTVRTLTMGAGLLVHVRIDELTTILCHEMAHAKAGDTRLSWIAFRFNHALVSTIRAQYERAGSSYMRAWLSRLTCKGLILYYRLFSLLYSADERWRELCADRMAALACGPQNVRNALIKIHLASYIPELSIESLLAEYGHDESEMTNLYAEYRRRWEELPTERLQAAENEMFLDRHGWYDSHPCLADRVRGLKDIEAKEVTGAKRATLLFGNWDYLEATMTASLVNWARSQSRKYMARLLTAGR